MIDSEDDTMRKPFFWAERKAWYLRVPVDGKLKTVRLGTTRTEAYDEWDRLKTAAVESATTKQSPTVDELITAFVAHIKSDAKLGRIKPKTVKRRIDYLAPFLAVCGDITIDELKPHHVTDWLRSKSTWNATTRADGAAAVKQAIKWAADEGRIKASPIENLRVAKGSPRDHVITLEEYRTLLAEVWTGNYARRRSTAFRQVLIALRLSGCRPSEIVAVNIRDFDGTTWTIKEHKTKKKKRKPRMVYLSPCLQTLSRIAARGRESGPLFLANADRGWKYSDLRLRFQRLRAKAYADPKCVLYSFRHTWITNALLAGVDVATVAEMAGTSIQMIDRHYGHLSQHRQHLSEAAAKVAKAGVAAAKLESAIEKVGGSNDPEKN